METNITTINGKLKPIGNRVLVSDMYFGEQVTSSGIVLLDDDGKTEGIYPRWGKVYAKGPKNEDNFQVGDWVLVEHGRWTRGIKINDNGTELTIRMVEAESILASDSKKPNTTL